MTTCVLVAIMLGILTSIGVAWGLAGSRPIPSYPRTVHGAYVQWERPWQIVGSGRFGAFEWWWMDLRVVDPDRSVQELVTQSRDEHARLIPTRPGTVQCDEAPTWGMFARTTPPPDDLMIGADAGFGWPALCTWDQITGTLTGHTLHSDVLHGSWLLKGQPSSRGRDCIALPLRPIWRGLIIDGAFYGALWWLVLFIPMMLRRARRRARGRCQACGYDLQHNIQQGCPECGWNRART